VKVISATRDHANKNRWHVRLDCGHEAVVTSPKGEPKRATCWKLHPRPK